MLWYLVIIGAAVAVIGTLALAAAGRLVNPYARRNHPENAPPRGTPGRRWWRRNARQDPGPGSPL